MGMDVHGIKPKQNKTLSEFPVYHKYTMMEKSDEVDNIDGFKQKWKELDADKELMKQYHKEMEEYEQVNVGHYFRNNCWWWRPLWNYCYTIADDLISEELFDSGHHNDGSGLNDEDAKKLGNILMDEIASGRTIQHQASHQQYLDDLPDDDCWSCKNNNHGHNKKKECKSCNKTGKTENLNKNRPFDVDNVENFAKFCLECGGFEIC